MRYKSVVWDHYNTFAEELRHIKWLESKNKKYLGDFRQVDNEQEFLVLLNTFAWLVEYCYPHFSPKESNKKPTNEEILKSMDYIELHGHNVLSFSKKYGDKEIRSGLRTMAKKMIDCSHYYRELIDKDFFKNK
ncbi:hypothetical protein D3C81_1067750 [compost metagenome]